MSLPEQVKALLSLEGVGQQLIDPPDVATKNIKPSDWARAITTGFANTAVAMDSANKALVNLSVDGSREFEGLRMALANFGTVLKRSTGDS